MGTIQLSKPAWSSQWVFILAAVGSAVGLGNLWKFPYIAGENGGGAFVLVYLLCVVLIGLPVLMAEIGLGRMGKANPPQAMANLAATFRASPLWGVLGIMGVLAGLLILSFYTVIAGWAIDYFTASAVGQFRGVSHSEVSDYFEALLASPGALLFWHTVMVGLTVAIAAKGVKSGLEKAINVMMPLLFLILLVLLGWAAAQAGFAQSVSFLFEPSFSKLSWEAVLVAMGHAFFTLSIGMGAMMVYGSYLPDKYAIGKAAVWIVFADTLVALLAGVIIFTVVFSNGLAPGAGPGLLFQTLPIAFGQMSGGWFWGTLFFFLVVLAALSSAISLIEPAVSWVEQNWRIERTRAAWLLGGIVWLLGVGTVLSFNVWSEVHFLPGKTFFDSLDFITANLMLPLGGLLIAVFMAWVVTDQARRDEYRLPSYLDAGFKWDLRYIAPLGVMIVFASNLAQDPWKQVLAAGSALLLYALYVYNRRRSMLQWPEDHTIK